MGESGVELADPTARRKVAWLRTYVPGWRIASWVSNLPGALAAGLGKSFSADGGSGQAAQGRPLL